jgi:hypothetical protein
MNWLQGNIILCENALVSMLNQTEESAGIILQSFCVLRQARLVGLTGD